MKQNKKMPNSGEINRTKWFCSPWRIKGTTFSQLVPKRYMFRFKGHSGKIIIGGRRKLWLLRQRTCVVYNRTFPFHIKSSCCKKSVQIANWIFHPPTRCLHRATKESPFLLLQVQFLEANLHLPSQPLPTVPVSLVICMTIGFSYRMLITAHFINFQCTPALKGIH